MKVGFRIKLEGNLEETVKEPLQISEGGTCREHRWDVRKRHHEAFCVITSFFKFPSKFFRNFPP